MYSWKNKIKSSFGMGLRSLLLIMVTAIITVTINNFINGISNKEKLKISINPIIKPESVSLRT